MRYSKQRELVMQTVQQLCDHPTAEEIYDKAAQECPNLSLGTVYRNLNSLVEAGRVRRVSIPGKADRFDHTLPWHSHLYCTVCGGVTDAEVDGKQNYKYAHSYANHWVQQQYLPDVLKDTKYYTFGDNKTEQAARAYWAKIKGEENV